MSPLPSNNRDNRDSSKASESSPATTEGMVKALDNILVRFPKASLAEESLLGLSLPATPTPGTAGPDDIQARLDAIELRVAALSHDKEASDREKEFLRNLVRDLLQKRDLPPRSDQSAEE